MQHEGTFVLDYYFFFGTEPSFGSYPNAFTEKCPFVLGVKASAMSIAHEPTLDYIGSLKQALKSDRVLV